MRRSITIITPRSLAVTIAYVALLATAWKPQQRSLHLSKEYHKRCRGGFGGETIEDLDGDIQNEESTFALPSLFVNNNVTATTIRRNENRHKKVTKVSTFHIIDLFKIQRCILNVMLLLSPKTWWGVLEVQNMVSGSAFSIETLSEGIWGFLLPLLALWNCKELLSASEPWLQLCLVSPWFMACYHCIATQLLAVWPGLWLYATGRATALPSANTCFNERVQMQRAYRTQRYDVYLPPQTSEPLVDAKGNRVQQALLFFPGALVPHFAYSEVLSQLSDAGFVVVVVSVEPLRLAYHRLGTDQGSIKRIMNQIATNITRRSSRGDKQSHGVVKFTLMGHSMGSFAAMRLFDEFHNSTDETTAKTSFCISHKLILWGVAAFVPFATNLTHHNNAELLIVQGSNDHIRDMMQSCNAALQALFPSQTTVQTIDGGTHDGFGSYTFPNTNKSSTNGDMDRTLQQKDACRLTTNFLRS